MALVLKGSEFLLRCGLGFNTIPNLQKDTGKCYFNSFGIKNGVVCEPGSVRPDNVYIRIRKQRPEIPHGETLEYPDACSEMLNINIINGMFSCYYKQTFCIKPGCDRWCNATTKRQELTSDKQTYRKGDVITGRIDFECLVECPECPEKPETVIVKGVFKTILK
jgi:hypothetical protein